LKPFEEKSYNAEDIARERIERVKECRETRLRAAKALALEGAEKAAEENPTATYEHCLMRVKTMSEKRLATRVSGINFILLLQLRFLHEGILIFFILCCCIHSR
jgi:hypothetical protein